MRFRDTTSGDILTAEEVENALEESITEMGARLNEAVRFRMAMKLGRITERHQFLNFTSAVENGYDKTGPSIVKVEVPTQSDGWQAGATVMTGPGLAADDAVKEEVVAALQSAGFDTSKVEEIGPGLYMIPIPEADADALKTGHIKHLEFSLRIPAEVQERMAKMYPIAKAEFATHVTFIVEVP